MRWQMKTERARFTARRKQEAGVRLLRGENLDTGLQGSPGSLRETCRATPTAWTWRSAAGRCTDGPPYDEARPFERHGHRAPGPCRRCHLGRL